MYGELLLQRLSLFSQILDSKNFFRSIHKKGDSNECISVVEIAKWSVVREGCLKVCVPHNDFAIAKRRACTTKTVDSIGLHMFRNYNP